MEAKPSKQLTREQMIERLAALEEAKRRKRAAKPIYTPTPGQNRVLSSKKKFVWNFSGNGGGKTTINVQMAHAMMEGKNPWSGEKYKTPGKIAFVVDTSSKIDERIIPEFRKWWDDSQFQLDKKGRPYTFKMTYLPTGTELMFITADADPKAFESLEFSAVFVDEPIPRTLYIALLRSLRMKGYPNKFLFSGTAITQRWLNIEIYQPWSKGLKSDTDCFNLKTEDNKANLADGYVETFGAALSEAEKKVRLEGGFFDMDSLALAEYLDHKIHVIPADLFHYDYRMPCVVAIDPHMSKPTTAVMLAAMPRGGWVAVKELEFKGTATQFADALKLWERGYSVVDRVCDSLGATDKTSGEGMHSFIEGLTRNGILVRSVTYKEKNHEDLIDRLRQGLAIPNDDDEFGEKVPLIRFTTAVPKLLDDIEHVSWQKNRMTGEFLPKLDTSTKDFLSCLGYGLAADLNYDFVVQSQPRPVQMQNEEQQERASERRAQIKSNLMARTRRRYFERFRQ